MAKSKSKSKGGAPAVATETPVAVNETPVAETPVAVNETDAAEIAAVSAMYDDAPKGGKLGTVDIAQCFMGGNVRPEEDYDTPLMVQSIERQGFLPNHPIVVSKQSDGRLLVLCGNRRFTAVQWLQENKPDAFSAIFPKGTIPAVVHSGLTPAQEALLRVDHGKSLDRKGLPPWGEFLAVEALAFNGYDSEAAIAAKLEKFTRDRKTQALKPARNWASNYVRAAVMGRAFKPLRQALEQLLRHRSGNLRISDIAGLWKAYNAEFRQFPNCDGPEFTKAWADACSPPTAKRATTTRPLTPKGAETLAGKVSSANLRNAIMAATEIDETRLIAVDASMVEIETAAATLAAIANYLGETEFATLVADAQAAVA